MEDNREGNNPERAERNFGGDRERRDDRGGDRGDRGGDRGGRRRDYMQGGAAGQERPKSGPMEVIVENNIEKAMKILKRKLIKEGLFKELKSRRYFEKPSERRKRKEKESIKKIRKEEARQKKNPFLFS